MDIQLLASELCKTDSYSDPVKKLYDANALIPTIVSSADITMLDDLYKQCSSVTSMLGVTRVNITMVKTHAKVVKPFISNLDIEDDFI